MIDAKYLTDDWTTVAVNPAPPGLIAVYEDGDGFYTAPCSAILLQERLADDGAVRTRAVAACFDTGGGGGGELHPVDSLPLGYTAEDLRVITTADRWKADAPEAERLLTQSIDYAKERILRGLRSRPDGVTKPELERAVRRISRGSRSVVVFNDLCEFDDRVTWSWENRPDDPDAEDDGMVCVARLTALVDEVVVTAD